MLTAFIYFSLIGFMCSIVGHVVSNILLYENLLNWYGKLIERLPQWLGKPLGLCVLCFSGQLALWSSLIYAITQGYNLVFVPYTICLSIFLVSKYIK